MTPQIVQFLVTAHLSMIGLLLILFVSANIFYQIGKNRIGMGVHYTLRGGVFTRNDFGWIINRPDPGFSGYIFKGCCRAVNPCFYGNSSQSHYW